MGTGASARSHTATPNFVQLHASETWGRAELAKRAEITEEDLREAEPRVRSRVDVGLYAARYDRATTAEQRYLQAMASSWQLQARSSLTSDRRLEDFAGSVERVRSGEVARDLGQSLTALGPVRDRLIRKACSIHLNMESSLSPFLVLRTTSCAGRGRGTLGVPYWRVPRASRPVRARQSFAYASGTA